MSKTICVVDDQPSLRQMLRFTLSAHGHKVLEAENALDALQKLDKEPVDMLIVDWQMPLMDGLELVRKLRKKPAFKDLPVVVVSCRDDLGARREAYSLGVITWLKKPFRMAEFQRVVENGLGLSASPTKSDQHSATGHI